jgi:mono/diheme cytochrome c family protein
MHGAAANKKLLMKKTLMMLVCGAFVLYACNNAGTKEKPEQTQHQPTPQDAVARGKYLVNVMGCNDCHSPKMMTPQGPVPDTGRLLSGHPATEQLPPYDANTAKAYVLFNMGGTAVKGPWGTSFSANLTPDDSGIGNWSEEQFIKAMKQGKWKGMDNSRTLLPPMPWQGYTQMTDEDVKAIFAYLKQLKPINNVVPAPLPPTAAR